MNRRQRREIRRQADKFSRKIDREMKIKAKLPKMLVGTEGMAKLAAHYDKKKIKHNIKH